MARRSTKKATKKITAKRKPRERSVQEAAVNLNTRITKTIRISVPCLRLSQRETMGDERLTQKLSGENPMDYYGSSRRNISMYFKDDHIHASAGCSSVYRLMSKSDYQAFRKWADSHFGIK